jgi:hypothetical protein
MPQGFGENFHSRLGQMARDLATELYPGGLPRGTKFSELETIAGALGDEIARQLIEIDVQDPPANLKNAQSFMQLDCSFFGSYKGEGCQTDDQDPTRAH